MSDTLKEILASIEALPEGWEPCFECGGQGFHVTQSYMNPPEMEGQCSIGERMYHCGVETPEGVTMCVVPSEMAAAYRLGGDEGLVGWWQQHLRQFPYDEVL